MSTPFQNRSMNPRLSPSFFTGSSKLATRLRVIPKMLKKPSQKDLASASSLLSFSHSLAKARERLLISFQLRGMVGSSFVCGGRGRAGGALATGLEVLQRDHVVGRFLVGVGVDQGLDGGLDEVVLAHQLDLVLRDLLDPALLAEEGVAAREGAELALPQGLPAAAVVVADLAGAGVEHGVLDQFEVGLRHVEAQLVHGRPQYSRL